MTVIILARATTGFVVAADSRTCSGNLPYTIEPGEAVKVRVHSFRSGGYVTASSGRARISGEPLAEVEKRFVAEHAGAAHVPSPTEFAEHLRNGIKQSNLAHECECKHNMDRCVYTGTCDPCLDKDQPEPACAACATPRWTSYGFGQDDCPCSPGEGLPSDTPPRYSWCRCTTEPEGPLEWLCVPFGPDRGDAPITVTIGPFHEDVIDPHTITRFPRVQGELRTRFTDKFKVVSETVEQAAAAETDGADANMKTLADTVTLVRELLITAYREGPDAAALRKEVALPSDDPENKGPFTIREVADKVRDGKKLDGVYIYDEVGVSSIGGPALFVTALDDGTTSAWAEEIPRPDTSPRLVPPLPLYHSPVRR